MKTVCKLDNCAGCMACYDICPVNAIKIQDDICAYNAIINEEKCIDCNLCKSVCAQVKSPKFHSPICWYQGWNNENIRMNSSSGGFASGLMSKFIDNGGIVCTCEFKDAIFGFDFIYDKDEIYKFIGSKYVKSNPKGMYKKIKELLKNNKKVLLIALPCQIASAIRYMGNLKDNLYTVDLICHGSPSPIILDSFLNENNYFLNDIETITFRKKNLFGIFINDQKIKPYKVRDRYTIGFLNGLFYSKNCYSCKYAKTERVSDLTIGDSWGSDLKNEIDHGISLVLCNTDKGKRLLESCDLTLKNVNVDNAINNNHQLYEASKKPDCYEKVMKKIKKGKKIKSVIFSAYPNICIRQEIKEIMYKLKLERLLKNK